MFVCQKCTNCEFEHFVKSMGKCEICGDHDACNDCPPSHIRRWNRGDEAYHPAFGRVAILDANVDGLGHMTARQMDTPAQGVVHVSPETLRKDPWPIEPVRRNNTGTKTDLDFAGIPMPFDVGGPFGSLAGWHFTFNNYYWVAKASDGAPLPHKYADPLHEARGREVRVEGNCGCPSPQRWCNPSRGFAGVSLYHVDTIDGLKALANAIRQWRDEMAPEAGMSVRDWQHAKAKREHPPLWTHDCERCRYMGHDVITQNTGMQMRRVDWYVCDSGRDLDKIQRDPAGKILPQKDCRGNDSELLNSTIIGRFGNEGRENWSMDLQSVAGWYDPKNAEKNTGPSKMIDVAQDKVIEFELWTVQYRRPK